MRNTSTSAFLLVVISCGDLFLNAEGFIARSTTTRTKRPLSHRHVGISHIPDDFASVQDVASTQAHPISNKRTNSTPTLNPVQAAFTKYALISYIAHLCIALPTVLFPTYLKNEVMIRLGFQTKSASEHEALQVSQQCASTLLKMIPFMNVQVSSPYLKEQEEEPVPTIWVSNHVSMLDTFIFLSLDEQLRGKNRRPIKTIYWKGLDSNPICKLVFKMSGFIPIDMADNGNGNPNEYDRASFKNMLKETKRAIDEGFDIFILPEGQLNPTPETGLQPVFGSPYAIAKSSKRPIQMIGLYGCHHLWHADEKIGMNVVGRDVKVKVFPPCRKEFTSAEEFVDAFNAVVGTFGASGQELPSEELEKFLA